MRCRVEVLTLSLAFGLLLASVDSQDSSQAPTILTPPSLLTCTPVDLNWSNAQGKVFLSIHKSDDPNGPAIKQLPTLNGSDGHYAWTVDVPSGQNVILRITDETGKSNASGIVPVVKSVVGDGDHCPGNASHDAPKGPAGQAKPNSAPRPHANDTQAKTSHGPADAVNTTSQAATSNTTANTASSSDIPVTAPTAENVTSSAPVFNASSHDTKQSSTTTTTPHATDDAVALRVSHSVPKLMLVILVTALGAIRLM